MHLLQKKLCFAPRIATALMLLSAFCAFGQQPQASDLPPELKRELAYVERLQQNAFTEIADLVLSEVMKKFPQAQAKAAELKLKGALSRGDFDSAKERIGAEEKLKGDVIDVWAMKIALADAFYAYGKCAETKGIYISFFKKYEKAIPPEVAVFYSDAAYRYAQILLALGEKKAAYGAYTDALRAVKAGSIPEHVERQMMGEKAEVALSLADDCKNAKEKAAYCKDAGDLADKLLWKQDVWFGKAIVLKSHCLLLEGNPEGAKDLVERYTGILTMIHDDLLRLEKETGDPSYTRVSPMAECRYLLAVMLREKAKSIMDSDGFSPNDAKKREEVLSLLLGSRKDGKRKGNGAYNHFLNVYLKYPESNWAADAGKYAEEVRGWLVNDFGGNVVTSVTPELTARVRSIQFQNARRLFSQGQIEAARDALLVVINAFPSCSEVLPALSDLAQCYMQNIATDPDAELYSDTVIAHIAERFCSSRDTVASAGDTVIRLAEYWIELGRPDKRMATYELFFKLYSDHPACPNYLASFGEAAYRDGDFDSALHYFGIVAESHKNSPRALGALNRMCTIYDELGDLTNSVAVSEEYVKRLEANDKPTQELMGARYRKAEAYRKTGQSILRSDTTNEVEIASGDKYLKLATKEYNLLADTLKSPPPSAQVNAEEEKLNDLLRQTALFNVGYCMSQLRLPEKSIPAFRKHAIKSYQNLVEAFPKSEFAPKALIQIGSLWMMLRDSEPEAIANSEAALSQLRKDYPKSDEAQSALPLIADNLMKLGMRTEAVARYRDMFTGASASQYSALQLLRAARALISAKEYDLAQQGVDLVLKKSEDIAIVAPAKYAEAELLAGSGKYARAVEKLNAFIKEYANLSLILDANLLLASAASEAGMVEKDENLRFDLFNSSLTAMKEVQRRRTNAYDRAYADIEIGRIMARKAKAEGKFGTKEKAQDYLGKAIISFQSFIDSANPQATRLTPLVEIACFEVIPLLQDFKQWDMVKENCDAYLLRFPNGKNKAQVDAWRNIAITELGVSK